MTNEQAMYGAGVNGLQYLQQAQLLAKVAKIAAFNRNPTAFSSKETGDIIAMAQELGLNTDDAKQRDKATLMQQVGSGLGGAADAMLLGLIPDNWYSNYRTKTGKNVGKVVGTLASFLVPGLGTTKALKGLFGAGKHGIRAAKTAYGVTKAANAAEGVAGAKDVAAIAKAIFGAGGKSLVSGVRAAHRTAGTIGMANALVRAMQLNSNANSMMYPSQFGEQSPYDSVGGMPVMR